MSTVDRRSFIAASAAGTFVVANASPALAKSVSSTSRILKPGLSVGEGWTVAEVVPAASGATRVILRHEATERVVNQFLAELDGMEELRGVAIIGATNRPDRIDPALLRPGRFDELVYVPVPDAAARQEILAALTRSMTLASDVDLEHLAEVTEGYTGADLRAACTKAGLLAIRENPEALEVGREHFLLAVKETLPSVTEDTKSDYEQVARKVKQQQSRIGFAAEG